MFSFNNLVNQFTTQFIIIGESCTSNYHDYYDIVFV